jgi:hypothetical protein
MYLYTTVIKKNPGGGEFFAHVQIGPGANPASCTMGTGSFPGVKCPGSSAEVGNEKSYISASPLDP